MNYQLTNPKDLRALLTKHGFTFSKRLGQNFLVDSSVPPRMADAVGADEHTGVLEIGPGVGVLTRELASRAGKVVAIELDSRLIPVLGETLEDFGNVRIIEGDVLKTDLAKVISEEFAGMDEISVCANLPYYITSPVLMYLLEQRLPLTSITVMVQKEAAERICALPATRVVGAVSFAVRYYSEPELLFSITPASFMPQPSVNSSVIRLTLHKELPLPSDSEKVFFSVVKAAFSQRRKTAANALSNGLSLPKGQVQQAFENAGLNPQSRAEQLTMEQFFTLSEEIKSLKK